MTNIVLHDGYMDVFLAFEVFQKKSDVKDHKNYEKLLRRLVDSNLIISAETGDKEILFNNSFEEYLSQREKNFNNIGNGNIPPIDIRGDFESQNLDSGYYHVDIDLYSSSIKYNKELTDEMKVSQTKYLEKLIAINSLDEEHAGIDVRDTKNRFLLIPPKVSFDGENYMFPGVFLTVFKHGYAILHMSIDLEKYDLNKINMNMWNIEFEKIFLVNNLVNTQEVPEWRYKKKARISSANKILVQYKDLIRSFFQNGEDNWSTEFNSLTMINYSYKPKEFFEDKKIQTDNFNYLIFILLNSPVTKFTIRPQVQIEEMLNRNVFIFSKGSRLYANSNRILNVVDDKYKETMKKSLYSSEVSKEKIDNIIGGIIHKSILGGNVNAIEILMLKKLSSNKLSLFKVKPHSSLKELLEIKTEENKDYTFEFSKFFYRYKSVIELIDFLNNACENHIQSKLVQERRQRIENLIEDKKDKHLTAFSILGILFTITFSLIFSLETLNEIFKLLDLDGNVFFAYVVFNLFFLIVISWVFRDVFKGIMNSIYSSMFFRTKILIFKLRNIFEKLKKK
ncbi:hypothetical protein [Salisediminibacterium halotolerans]|uniref:hypothetical protein n=1 Tax=Salisediminibacterium halotolerans TaxID=517425 RepID=UPI000EB4D120|nr:hypothetical protein [Salisediminibacterium halotolerans]RLJ72215.1 hypothetical protein BCL39_2109 [Actinophytocola xinjiangensis]RPE85428.1 hypothetical protein EDD67_2244 [Salisediminibacterium halotolerans]TWG33385.1 hypothetical protein BCL52_2105 [Salisediminibacterium halotolerans]GEL07086.1 hypothetical protein SHA02_05020 [Salisediminibacterium halotolerans]